MSVSPREAFGTFCRHGILIVMALFILAPFLWMLSISLKSPQEIFESVLHFWPHHWYALENYSTAVLAAPLVRCLLNGAFVCSVILACQILTAAPIAYALAKLSFPGRDILFTLVALTILIPIQTLALPLYVIFYGLGILNTYAALILPFCVSPFAIILLRQVFRTIPDELIHAARLDGLGELAIVFRVLLPLAKPALAAFAILSIVAHWNDLYWPMIAVQRPELATPSLAVVFFRSSEAGASYGPLMAGAVVIVLPLLVAFAGVHRWLATDLANGSLK